MQDYYSSNSMYGQMGLNDGGGYAAMNMGFNPYNNPAMAGVDVMGMDIMDPSMMVPMDPYTGAPVAGGYYDEPDNLINNTASHDTDVNVAPAASYSDTPEFSRWTSSNDLQRRKSFTGPLTQEDKATVSAHRSRSMSRVQSTRSVGHNEQTGLARTGSMFRSNRDRDTQVSISMRGGMGDSNVLEVEEEKQYYGDMAERQTSEIVNGLKAVKSYRGAIEDGEDVGRPRRVTTRSNVNGHSSTGYGGINFKRSVAMAKGEQWGDAKIIGVKSHKPPASSAHISDRTQQQSKSELPPQMPYQQNPFDLDMMRAQAEMEAMEMAARSEQGVPHVYQKEEVRTYSNLSDMF